MDGLRFRWLALAGPAFTLLFVVLVFVVQGDTPGTDATPDEVVGYFADERTTSLAGAFLSPLLALLLLLFTGHVRAVVRERRVSTGAGPTVMVSGAVLWAGGILLGSAVELALSDAADQGRPQAAEALNILANASWLPFIAGIAVFLVGAALTVLTSDFLPRWLGWVALVAGVVSLAGPGGFLGFFVGPLWLLVAGVLLARPDAPLRDPHRVERRELSRV